MAARDGQSYVKRVLRLVPGLVDAYRGARAIVSYLRNQQSLIQALAPFWPRSAGSPDVLAPHRPRSRHSYAPSSRHAHCASQRARPYAHHFSTYNVNILQLKRPPDDEPHIVEVWL